MIHKRLSILLVGLSLSLLCLIGCNQNKQPQVDAVKGFLNAVNSFECEGLFKDDDPYSSQEFTDLSEAYQKFTTYSGASEDSFILMACDDKFTNMAYEVTYSDDTCSIVIAEGELRDELGDHSFDMEFVVIKDAKGWVIDFDADSCE